MMSIHYIAYAMIALGVFTFYMAVMNMFRTRRSRAQTYYQTTVSPVSEIEELLDQEASDLARWCEKILSKFKRDSILLPKLRKSAARKLMMAGITSPNAIIYFLFFKRFLQPILLLIGIFFSFRVLHVEGTIDFLLYCLLALAFLVTGIKGADMYVSNARQKRVQLLTYSFPEIMDLLLVCIESGLGVDAALNRVCKELRHLYPSMIAELDRTRLELTMLGDRVQALQNLADRTDTLPFKTLASALIQTEKFGTSLVDTLRVLSEEERLTRLYEAEQKAARIPVLITIPLILFIMPAFMLIILGPPFAQYMEQQQGVSVESR